MDTAERASELPNGLDNAEKAALIALLNRMIATDPFPLSPRIRTLRAILAG
jgi:hypothetical protein